jgi:hypothetical protein
MSIRAASTSPFAAALLEGPARQGIALGHGYVRFDRDVLAITPPGTPRMPNGIAVDLPLRSGRTVIVGEGALRVGTTSVVPGPIWNPRPALHVALSLRPKLHVRPEALAGVGPGLTPLGDDVLVGYLAAAALLGAPDTRLATTAAAATTALSSTLLLLAADGALPESAHLLLERADPTALLDFGATSGKGIAVGLAWRLDVRAAAASTLEIELPLGGTSRRLTVLASAVRGPPQPTDRRFTGSHRWRPRGAARSYAGT